VGKATLTVEKWRWEIQHLEENMINPSRCECGWRHHELRE